MTFKYPNLHKVDWIENELRNSTLREIAEKIGCSYSAVVYVTRKYGLKIPTRTRHKITANLSEVIKQSIRKKYPNGRFGKLAANWRGGRRKIKQGYVYVFKPDHPKSTTLGYVMEHRLVAEKIIGRLLEDDEIVHHIDGVKDNNDPSNLKVIKKVDHVKEHFKAVQEVDRLKKILMKHGIKFS